LEKVFFCPSAAIVAPWLPNAGGAGTADKAWEFVPDPENPSIVNKKPMFGSYALNISLFSTDGFNNDAEVTFYKDAFFGSPQRGALSIPNARFR
jgi:hypothetical protein